MTPKSRMHGARHTGMILMSRPGLKSASTTSVLMTSIEKGKLFFTPLMWHASILCVNNFILICNHSLAVQSSVSQVGKLGGGTHKYWACLRQRRLKPLAIGLFYLVLEGLSW